MRLIIALLAVAGGLFATHTLPAQKPSGPDFPPIETRRPASVAQAIQLSDNSRILLGDFEWVNGRALAGCVRFTADGALDSAFNRRIAPFAPQIMAVMEAPGRKLLVVHRNYNLWNDGQITAQYSSGLMRLNWDGSRDPAFPWLTDKPDTPFMYNQAALAVQPNGAVLLAGWLAGIAQGREPCNWPLVRLSANGQLDTAFQQQLRPVFAGTTRLGSGPPPYVRAIRLGPNGTIVLGGRFFDATGRAGPGLVRLLGTGALDPTFTAALDSLRSFKNLAVQPGGRVLAIFKNEMDNEPAQLMRLLPNGQPDRAFRPAQLRKAAGYAGSYETIQLQTDGRILVTGTDIPALRHPEDPRPIPFVRRLLPNGKTDRNWQLALAGKGELSTVQPLPNGQLLVAGSPLKYDTRPMVLPVAVAVLASTGAYLPEFIPLLQRNGDQIKSVTQPDGQQIVYGQFSEINGLPAHNVARLRADGTPDTAFLANARSWSATNPTEERVYQVKLESSGTVLIAGEFSHVGELPRAGLARLLASGLADPYYPPAPYPPLSAKQRSQLFIPILSELPLDSLYLYRNCHHKLIAPSTLPPNQPRLRFEAIGGRVVVDESGTSLSLQPTADRFTVLAYWGRDLVYKYGYAVRPIPPPKVRCLLDEPRRPLQAGALNGRYLRLQAIPEAAFANFMPDDARYRVVKARISVLRHKVPVGEALDYSAEMVARRQIPLAQLNALARPGDQLRVEFQGIQRMNFANVIEDIAVQEQVVIPLP